MGTKQDLNAFARKSLLARIGEMAQEIANLKMVIELLKEEIKELSGDPDMPDLFEHKRPRANGQAKTQSENAH